MKPFIKWAGGKRWLIDQSIIEFPEFNGRYYEPFLGGAAAFFHLRPPKAVLSDLNPRLIETYLEVKNDWKRIEKLLRQMHRSHSKTFYYEERARKRQKSHTRAAQFLYLNRTCWNGLYRENLKGQFNVPIGTKTQVVMADDNFENVSQMLKSVVLRVSDFEEVIWEAGENDLVFVDPPYTTAHNMNGFVKYNQKIFSWEDQKRLKSALAAAKNRGAKIIMTNADHLSIRELYGEFGVPQTLSRNSVISGGVKGRGKTSEVLYVV